MSGDRRKEIVRHLSEDDLNRLLAESTNQKLTERLIFLKRLYKGATWRTLPTTSAGPPPQQPAGSADGTTADSGF